MFWTVIKSNRPQGSKWITNVRVQNSCIHGSTSPKDCFRCVNDDRLKGAKAFVGIGCSGSEELCKVYSLPVVTLNFLYCIYIYMLYWTYLKKEYKHGKRFTPPVKDTRCYDRETGNCNWISHEKSLIPNSACLRIY